MSKILPIISGRVDENGKLKLPPEERQKLELWLESLVNQEVELTVGKRRNGRTISQNSYYFGVVAEIPAQHYGYSKDEMHLIFKTMFLRKKIKFQDKEITVIPSTANLSTEEFSEYIEKVKMWCAGEGLNIPDPEEVVIKE